MAETSWPSPPAVTLASAPPEGSCGSRPMVGGRTPSFGLHTYTHTDVNFKVQTCKNCASSKPWDVFHVEVILISTQCQGTNSTLSEG